MYIYTKVSYKLKIFFLFIVNFTNSIFIKIVNFNIIIFIKKNYYNLFIFIKFIIKYRKKNRNLNYKKMNKILYLN